MRPVQRSRLVAGEVPAEVVRHPTKIGYSFATGRPISNPLRPSEPVPSLSTSLSKVAAASGTCAIWPVSRPLRLESGSHVANNLNYRQRDRLATSSDPARRIQDSPVNVIRVFQAASYLL